VSDGVQTAEFDREAGDLADAVASAIKAVETTTPVRATLPITG
jgi:hypothetical protein